MASSGNPIKRTSQAIDNLSFDEDFEQASVEIVGYDGSALQRVKTDADGNLQVDVLSGGTTEWGYCADSLTVTYQYYFFEDKSLNYKIMRETLATGVYAYATGAGSYTSVYVDSTSDPAGSPTFGTYGAIF
jgi:hypothetical protein